MPSSIVTGLNVGNPVGNSSEHFNIGAEAQNVIVSYDENGHIIEDITGQTVASTKTLSNLLKGSAGNYIGTCETGASISAKVVTVPADYNFDLKPGVMIGINFTNTNIASDPTINVNDTGAKPVFKGNSIQTSGDAGMMGGYMNFFQYDGTNWCWISSGLKPGGGGGGTGGGHVIENNAGSEMPQEDNLQFKSATVTDANGKTIVEIAPVMTTAQYEALSQAQKMDGTVRFISDGVGTLKSFTVEQALSNGIEIGSIIINGARTRLYAPDVSDVVQVDPTLTTGTEIGTITIDGTPYTLYGPRAVSVDRILNSGVEIGGITIGGARTALFAPDSGVWSDIVTCAVGETYCTIYSDAIKNTSAVDVYYQKAGSSIVYIKTQSVSTGRIYITFDALQENTSFKAKIYN